MVRSITLRAGIALMGILALLALAPAAPVSAVTVSFTNPSFETGNFTGWTVTLPPGGEAIAVPSHLSYTPQQGTKFARLKTDGPGSFTSIAQNFTVPAPANVKITGYAFFETPELTTPPCIFDDSAQVVIKSGATVLATVFRASVCTTGTTPWIRWEYTFLTPGTYTIEARIANDVDSVEDSYMGLDAIAFADVNIIKAMTFEGASLLGVQGADKIVGPVQLDSVHPLRGAYSAYIPNAGDTYLQENFDQADDLYVSFYLVLHQQPADDVRIPLISNAGTTITSIFVLKSGVLQLRQQGNKLIGATPPLQLETVYRIGIHQKRGAGGNAVVEGWLALEDLPFGEPFAKKYDGTWMSKADRLRIGATISERLDASLDNIKLAQGTMP